MTASGVIRIETQGSWWHIDELEQRYMRMPKEEKPRPNGWGGPDAGELQDLVWHPMTRWFVLHGNRLVIAFTDDTGVERAITAPLTVAEMLRQAAVANLVMTPGAAEQLGLRPAQTIQPHLQESA